jgi:Tol biopolymer transport system component
MKDRKGDSVNLLVSFVILLMSSCTTQGSTDSAQLQPTTVGGGAAQIIFSDRTSVYSMSPDGTDVARLPDYLQNTWFLQWTSDGARVVYSAFRADNWDIYRVDSDGASMVRLTDDPAADVYPRLSPDDTQIAFESSGDIWVMGIEGGDRHNLTNSPGQDLQPAWSPDGSSIAFVSDRDGGGPLALYTMTSDGLYPIKIAESGVTPEWSPDGNWIAFVSDRDGDFDVYVTNSDGQNERELTSGDAYEGSPHWSPDGNWIAFVSDRDGNLEVCVMKRDGSQQTTLTDSPATHDLHTWR